MGWREKQREPQFLLPVGSETAAPLTRMRRSCAASALLRVLVAASAWTASELVGPWLAGTTTGGGLSAGLGLAFAEAPRGTSVAAAVRLGTRRRGRNPGNCACVIRNGLGRGGQINWPGQNKVHDHGDGRPDQQLGYDETAGRTFPDRLSVR